jgi:hypothetical protein
MSLLRDLFGPSKDEIWSQLAAQVGGQFHDGGFFGRDRVTAHVGQWALTLDTYTVSHGKQHTTYTRMRAPYVNADDLRFVIYNTGIFSDMGVALGMQDIQVGDPEFDKAFVIKGQPEDKIRLLFSDRAFKALLYAQRAVQFEVKDDEGWFRREFPEHVDELYFRRVGVMKDLAELQALYDLFAYTLHRLCHIGSAYENDPGIRL